METDYTGKNNEQISARNFSDKNVRKIKKKTILEKVLEIFLRNSSDKKAKKSPSFLKICNS